MWSQMEKRLKIENCALKYLSLIVQFGRQTSPNRLNRASASVDIKTSPLSAFGSLELFRKLTCISKSSLTLSRSRWPEDPVLGFWPPSQPNTSRDQFLLESEAKNFFMLRILSFLRSIYSAKFSIDFSIFCLIWVQQSNFRASNISLVLQGSKMIAILIRVASVWGLIYKECKYFTCFGEKFIVLHTFVNISGTFRPCYSLKMILSFFHDSNLPHLSALMVTFLSRYFHFT